MVFASDCSSVVEWRSGLAVDGDRFADMLCLSIEVRSMLARIITSIRQCFHRGSFEHWDWKTVDAELETIRARLKLIGKTEDEARATLGEPTSVQSQSQSLQIVDDDGVIAFEADYGLVYDDLLPHSRIILHISDERVHSLTFFPKVKCCPASARESVGSYYAPV